jgi:hypothetical protein
LQLISDPILLASRQLNPAKYLAAIVQPPNFPVKARKQMAIVYAQVMPGNKQLNNTDQHTKAKVTHHHSANPDQWRDLTE